MWFSLHFPAGLGDLVLDALRQDLRLRRVIHRDDSSVLVDMSGDPAKVGALPYLRNAYFVLARTRRRDLSQSLGELTAAVRSGDLGISLPSQRPFRVMASVDGQLISLPPKSRSELESALQTRTRGQLNKRGGHGEEYWILGRRDLGQLLLVRRLPAQPAPKTPKGSLGRELAELLVRASTPTDQDVFLDPFGGSGAVIAARLGRPARRVTYSDTAFPELKARIAPELLRNKRVTFLDEDATTMPSIDDGTIDVIVTDPPWGEFEDTVKSYDEFAADMAASFHRLLRRPGGRFVILLARSVEPVVQTALGASGLLAEQKYPILVNGHPATVLSGSVSG